MAMRAEAAAAAELWDEIRAVAGRLSPEDLARPTPCPRWSVKDILAHMSGLQTAWDGSAPQPDLPDVWTPPAELTGLDAFTEVSVVARRDWTLAQLLKEIDVAKAGHVARLEGAEPGDDAMGPFGPTTMAKLHGTRMFDLWCHVQDIRLALGEKADTEASTLAGRDGARYMFASLPVIAAKRVGLTDGQRLAVRVGDGGPDAPDGVLEVVDGRARWADADGADGADDAVEATRGTLLLVLAGRRTPEDWRDDGVLSWRGELGEAFVRRARVFGG